MRKIGVSVLLTALVAAGGAVAPLVAANEVSGSTSIYAIERVHGHHAANR
jgi:hypothetical protein